MDELAGAEIALQHPLHELALNTGADGFRLRLGKIVGRRRMARELAPAGLRGHEAGFGQRGQHRPHRRPADFQHLRQLRLRAQSRARRQGRRAGSNTGCRLRLKRLFPRMFPRPALRSGIASRGCLFVF